MKKLKMSLLFYIAFCTFCTAGTPLYSGGHSYRMKLITLTQGKFAQVDDEDFDYINQWRWRAKPTRKNIYAVTNIINPSGKKETVYMHRFILKISETKIETDHIDHNGLNNQRLNLRTCTHSENQGNRRSFGKSKYLGVFLTTQKYKSKNGTIKIYESWIASLMKNKKVVYHKYFKTEIEAALAYNKAALEYHGEFANLNIIETLMEQK